MKKTKKIQVKRYLAVIQRRIKRVNRKKVLRWLEINLKQHPFILGLLFFIWIDAVLIKRDFAKIDIIKILKFHLYLFIFWLILVALLNLLRDKQKVKWYFRKHFVVFMLLPFFFPFGLILLWSGSKFKKATKIIFTLIFGSVFIIVNVYSSKTINKSSLERIVEMITGPKKKIFLKPLDRDVLSGLRLLEVPKKSRVKLAISEVAAQYSSSVVSIKTKDKDGRDLGMGSGFIISPDGLIVTNFHVVESAYQAEVKIGEDVFKEVYLVKDIPNLDIAILKINAENLPVLPLGDSDSLINGQFLIVLSNPWGFERSVSSGIVSAIRSKGDIKLIQMTAPVSPGSSGGPVINEYGEVVGITTLASFFMAQNLNFAIPINYLNKTSE